MPKIDVSERAIIGMLVVLPPLGFVVSWGDFTVYRAAQGAWVFLSFATVICLVLQNRASVSNYAVAFLTALWLPFFASMLRDVLQGREVAEATTAGRLVLFSLAILSFDIVRRGGFVRTLQWGIPLACLVIAITAAQMAVAPELVYGRHWFFGSHPNWGGEILFICALICLTSPRSVVRWAAASVVVVLLIGLQSRAALLATVAMFVLVELFVVGTAHRLREVIIMLASSLVLVLAFSLALFPQSLLGTTSVLADRILLLSDPYRGIGTGLAGRVDSFANFSYLLEGRSVLGAGLDSARWEEGNEYPVHNGFLALTAEYGISSIPLWIMVCIGLIGALRQDRFRAIAIIMMLFMFLFSARTINLNIFPFFLWVALLPWSPAIRLHSQLSRNVHDASVAVQRS